MIDLKEAHMFLRLCQTLNLTKAAALCEVSVSTLSRTLNKLESNLNVKLCIRDAKGITLTSDGIIFEKFVKDSLALYKQMQTKLSCNLDVLKGIVTIYCSVTASYIFIPKILNELSLQNNELELRVQTGDPADALSMLEHEGIDFVISAIPQDLDKSISYEHLASYPLILIAPKKSHIINYDKNAYDINKIPFILPSNGQLYTDVINYLQQHNLNPPIYSHIAGHEAIVSTCALGFAFAIVPGIVYELSPFKGDIQILQDSNIGTFEIGLCYKKSKKTEPKINNICQIVNKKC